MVETVANEVIKWLVGRNSYMQGFDLTHGARVYTEGYGFTLGLLGVYFESTLGLNTFV